jgi:hypothetical protein
MCFVCCPAGHLQPLSAAGFLTSKGLKRLSFNTGHSPHGCAAPAQDDPGGAGHFGKQFLSFRWDHLGLSRQGAWHESRSDSAGTASGFSSVLPGFLPVVVFHGI